MSGFVSVLGGSIFAGSASSFLGIVLTGVV
jgi:hypothetical protein